MNIGHTVNVYFVVFTGPVCAFLTQNPDDIHNRTTTNNQWSAAMSQSRAIKLTVYLFIVLLFVSPQLFASTVKVNELKAAPTIDGDGTDWSDITASSITLTNNKPNGKSDVKSIAVKAGVYGDEVFFYLAWKDNSKNDQHKPFKWNSEKNKYDKTSLLEDRLAMQFVMKGDYDVNWLSGKIFTADMWHWKAARSNPAGLMHDKRTILSLTDTKKAFKAIAKTGTTIYIKRPSDAGGPLYKTTRYRKKEQDIMPKYIINEKVSGSIADIKAKGVWKNGEWHLEIKRKLSTGNPDDVTFEKGKAYLGGIAVFNQTGDDDHNLSDIIEYQF